MKHFWAALGFLTILPVPARFRCNEEELPHALFWFPVVGFFIGLILLTFWWILSPLLPSEGVAALCVVTLVWLPGGMHMDGLADTADGFFSGQSGERLVTIMKDPAIGAFGALAMVTVLLVQWGVLAGMSATAIPFALLVAPLAGRSAMALVIGVLPYAHRETGGLGTHFAKNNSAAPAWVASILITLATCGGVIIFGWTALALPFVWGVTAALFSSYTLRKLGGHTGDTYGALNELTETVTLLVVAMIA